MSTATADHVVCKSLPGLSRVEVEDPGPPLHLRSRPSLPGSLLSAVLPSPLPALPNGASFPPTLPSPSLRPSSPPTSQDGSYSTAMMDKGPPRDVSPNLSRSRTEKFHKLFKSVLQDEEPIDYFSCAYKGDILLQGWMYLSANWICFHSKIKGRGRLLEISMESVISITREKMALIFPNAIGIQTANEKYVFGSFMGRDSVYKLLINLWKSTQDTEKAISAKPPGLTLCNGQSPSPFDSLSEEQDSHQSGEGNITDQEENEDDTGLHMHPVVYTDSSADPPTPAKCPKPPYPEKCWNLSRTLDAFCQSAIKLQNIPRTNLLIAVCSILVFFLLVSAVCLTYKILLLQSQMEMQNLWSPVIKHKYRDQVMSHMYHLQLETHMATVKQLHTVLKANIDLLQEMHVSLKSLQQKGLSQGSPEDPQPSCSTQQCPGET